MLLDRNFDVSTTPVANATLDAAAIRSIENFLFDEARLLDERRFADWLALWTDDGRYWVPRFHGQADPFSQISLFWEDRMLRETRQRRIEHARNWSQQPVTRTTHLVGNVQVAGLDRAGRVIVRSNLQLSEWRLELRQLAGQVHHKLEATAEGGWRMHLKRVDLVNCDAVFGALEVFI